MKIDDIFRDDTINIFSDGSIHHNQRTGETIGCAGSLIVFDKNKQPTLTTRILRFTTNNECEIMSIFIGLSYIIQSGMYIGKKINIFSDSNICVQGLKNWIFSWLRNSRGSTLYSSSGDPVANQEHFKTIIYYLLSYNISINIYHQKGHVLDSNNSLINAIKVFKNTNKISDYIDPELMRLLSTYNDLIDEYTKIGLDNMNYYDINTLHNKLERPFKLDISKLDINLYKKLIGGK